MKKLLLFILLFTSYYSFAYDLINDTYIINSSSEDIQVPYQRCSEGYSNSTVCDKSQTLSILSSENGDNIGRIPIMSHSYIHILKIKSLSKEVSFASVAELLQYISHGYKQADIMTCMLSQENGGQDFIIEDNINNKFTCRIRALFS